MSLNCTLVLRMIMTLTVLSQMSNIVMVTEQTPCNRCLKCAWIVGRVIQNPRKSQGKHRKHIRNLETIVEELWLLCDAADKQKVKHTRKGKCFMNENLWQCIIKTSQNMKVISWRVLQSRLINVGFIVQVMSSHWRILRKDDMLKNTYSKCTASWSQLEWQKLVKRGKIVQEIVARTGITT